MTNALLLLISFQLVIVAVALFRVGDKLKSIANELFFLARGKEGQR